jgi:glycosyltransferase involved in cell wall biosynthesis
MPESSSTHLESQLTERRLDRRESDPLADGRGTRPLLSIVIPAFNEEEAVAQTISRCLEARQRLASAAELAGVEVIVVSDGSTDRTAEIAQSFEDARTIVFRDNRGYGAAVKEGWRQAAGTLLACLDADGTCDPECFADLCRAASTESADLVIGARLGPESKMPRVRRLGNRIYAIVLGLLCGRRVTDTASGMRVVRREALKWLYPLPDGLDFTPAMSARALLNDLRLVETPIRYNERVGRSKLSVFKDGVRFLWAILSGVLTLRPERFLLAGFALCMAALILTAAYPVEFYVRHRRLEEGMITRFVACYLLGSFGFTMLLGTALCRQFAPNGRRRRSTQTFWPAIVAGALRRPAVWYGICFFLVAGALFLRPGSNPLLTTKSGALHWSRLLAGAFCLTCALQTALFSFLMRVVSSRRGEAES